MMDFEIDYLDLSDFNLLRDNEIKIKGFKFKPQLIDIYESGRFSPVKQVEHYVSPLIYLWISYHFTSNKSDMKNILKAINAVSNKDDYSGIRFAQKSNLSYKNLDGFTKTFLFEDYENEFGGIYNCYTIRKDFSLYSFIDNIISFKLKNTRIDRGKCLRLRKNEFNKMSSLAQIIIVKNIVIIENEYIYCKLNEKQEFGNYGRKYNILNLIPSYDREYIDDLYGVDISAAMQTIFIYVIKKYFCFDLQLTTYYINHKNEIRNQVMENMETDIKGAKEIITMIYQGHPYFKKFISLKEYFSEAEFIRNKISSFLGTKVNDSELEIIIKYATKRTIKKYSKEKPNWDILKYNIVDKRNKKHILSKQVRFEISKSFMFYFWSFFERKVQNIIASKLKYPLTLHDAVYTQNKEEFLSLNIKQLEEEILTITEIPIKLGLTKKI